MAVSTAVFWYVTQYSLICAEIQRDPFPPHSTINFLKPSGFFTYHKV